MAVTETLYTGDGSQTTYTITFPYLEAADVKASLNGTVTSAFTFPTATTLQFNTAPGNGVAIRIFRDTDDSALDATFSPDSSLRATDLNNNFTRLLYVCQESDDKSDLVAGAVADAEQALTLATAADANASAALSAVSAVVPVGDVAAVANIPGSPTNGQVVRVINSTGIESFSPLTGLPGGFVGSTGLAVTITWDGSTWNYIRYEPNDPDDRYLQGVPSGGVGTAQLADGAVTTPKLANFSVTQNKIGENVLTPRLASINGGPLAGLRNAIINGSFDVWQRGTSFTSNETYVADRWFYLNDGAGAARTISRLALTVGELGDTEYALRWNHTTAGSGANFNRIAQYIENVKTFQGKPVTISFKARAASSTTIPAISLFQIFGSGGSVSVVTTVTTNTVVNTGAFQTFSFTATVPSIAGKTVGAGNFLALVISGPLNQTFTLDITDVQVEEGPVATPFERRPLALEQTLCERYYEEGVYTIPTTGFIPLATFKTTKRANPTISIKSTISGGTGGGLSTAGTNNLGFFASSYASGGDRRIIYAADAEF